MKINYFIFIVLFLYFLPLNCQKYKIYYLKIDLILMKSKLEEMKH